ncbi:MAG TPA: anaerobic ribonucleoside-triphosphate reductase activating protein [Lachnospiraceae bacterium]|nr:anaerobic ribonucleoside-triphosphate reductase activating protein [Lachnospiraceae bacterium]
MQIHGLQKTTLLDYPGLVAATIFSGGCNLRCPFCHNMNLVKHPESEPLLSEEEIFSFLNSRKNLLDGICITGGEPTLQKDLIPFIYKIKELGYRVKLDTNGTFPNVLKTLIQNQLIDYVAMDIKSSPDTYAAVCGLKTIDLHPIQESISLLINGTLPYEFRTTVIAQYHNEAIFHEIGNMIRGAENYYLQSFQDSEYVEDHTLCACSKKDLLHYKDLLTQYVRHVELRGVD